MTCKRRLLFIVNVDWFFISHRLPIALKALDEGYEVHIATMITDRYNQLTEHGFVIHRLKMGRGGLNLWSGAKAIVELWSIFLQVKPTVVHLVTIKPVLLGGLVARMQNVQAVVIAVSGLGLVYASSGVIATLRRLAVSTLYRLVLRSNNLKVIFQNVSDMRTLQDCSRLKAGQCELIPGSGVDLLHYKYVAPIADQPIVMFASRLISDKGRIGIIAIAFQEASIFLKTPIFKF